MKTLKYQKPELVRSIDVELRPIDIWNNYLVLIGKGASMNFLNTDTKEFEKSIMFHNPTETIGYIYSMDIYDGKIILGTDDKGIKIFG